jgi:signal transduction histidine kinase
MRIIPAGAHQLSRLLRLFAFAASAIVVVTIGAAALWLASAFDDQARTDSRRMLEGGLSAFVYASNATVRDYANWDAAYFAVAALDIDWLDANVGSGAVLPGTKDAVVLAGGPFDRVHGWVDEEGAQLSASEFAQMGAIGLELASRTGLAPHATPVSTFAWVGGEFWLLSAGWVTPHESALDPDAPLALLVGAQRMDAAWAGSLAEAFLLDGVQIAAEPVQGFEALALGGLDGPVAQILWTAPQPGPRALKTVALPVILALAIVTVALGLGALSASHLAGRLETALIAAQAADRTKAEFIARLGHELRTPMNGIVGMLELLRVTGLDSEQAEFVEVALASSETQVEMIDHLLAIGRMESGQMTLSITPFVPEDLLEEVVALIAPSARDKGLDLSLSVAGQGGTALLGDRLAIRQIAVNLIGNAVKFTPQGHVAVHLSTEPALTGAQLRLSVTDTGPGVPPTDRDRIFEAFVQGDGSATRSAGGAGLGLSIARRLATQMGGTLGVDDAPGGGAVFTFEVTLDGVVGEPWQRNEAA